RTPSWRVFPGETHAERPRPRASRSDAPRHHLPTSQQQPADIHAAERGIGTRRAGGRLTDLPLPFDPPLGKRHARSMAPTPSLYEWLGGIEALRRLTTRFYERVPEDAVLEPVFAHMGPEHPDHVAAFLAEVLGGPADYSAQHGGHPEMIRHHLNRHLTNQQRKAWLALLLDTADEL